jgi:hypothetical protein
MPMSPSANRRAGDRPAWSRLCSGIDNFKIIGGCVGYAGNWVAAQHEP